jgi:hypothetical protein
VILHAPKGRPQRVRSDSLNLLSYHITSKSKFPRTDETRKKEEEKTRQQN